VEFLYELGLFLAQAIIIVVAVAAIILVAVAAGSKNKHKSGELDVKNLSEAFADQTDLLTNSLLSKEERKARNKALKAEKKREKKQDKEVKHRLFVVDFKGSIDAKEVSSLREEVTSILSIATPDDEVFVRLESGGGMVHGYGLAASQLARIRSAQIPLTVSVDKVAASGGYMMACIANKIIAAPFSIVGSIGVIAQLPNFHKLLKKHDIDFEQITAGEFKRTLTVFGKNTDTAREKFRTELEETHQLFKGYVSEYRPALDIESVATGEHWFGSVAFEKGLVDAISTSDDYLMKHYHDRDVIKVHFLGKKNLAEKLSQAVSLGVESAIGKLLTQGKWDWTR
jgi:serine protease SohB